MEDSADSRLSPQLRGLARQFTSAINDRASADAALRVVHESAPDERLALAFLLRLAELSPADLRRALAEPQRTADLVFCLGASELIGSGLAAIGAGWVDFFDHASNEPASSLIDSIQFPRKDVSDRREAAEILAAFKNRIFLRIAITDLLGHAAVSETALAMSRLADECIKAALSFAMRIMGEKAEEAGEFCVLALGKLGANELNLSSDVDLIYLSRADDPMRSEATARRIGELVTELLSQHCFRVDMRLRPGGRNSPLVIPIEGALSFYQDFGQTWERAALLRARPVGGAIHLGQELIAELGRFIYRSYLDFDTLRQLRAMKRQIEQELRSPAMIHRNIKLGRGGIRELEFVVQALTLIYGGRDRRLRTPHTLTALERLSTYGYMTADRAHSLKEAYVFLRDVEHKLQIAAGLQTHTLPESSEINTLAARMRFGKDDTAVARFEQELAAHRHNVARQFREMLASGDHNMAPRESAHAVTAWRTALDPKESAPALAELGFVHPTETAGHLELLAKGPAHAPSSSRRRELLDVLGPRLIDEVRDLADPDLAMRNLAAFIAAVGARTSFLALLEQHPATRRVLLRLFASSSYLSTIFIRHPDMLDTLVRSDLARLKRLPADLAGELSGLVNACQDFESRLDAIRAFRHQEFLRIAIADLAGDLPLDDVQAELTALAEVVVQEALKVATADVRERRPVPPELQLCVLAMGRVGAREMSYNSDLDLIFIYHVEGETAGNGHEAAARIMQRLIAILETRTREGYAYKIDLRLRPSGRSGPLVTSLEGFGEYHRQSAAVWERQSMVRARVIAGDPWLAEQVEAVRQNVIFRGPISAASVAEIAAMRARMEHEIGVENHDRLNVKQGRGGLVDIEFITQMVVLRHGYEFPKLRERNTVALIDGMRSCGLLSDEDAATLDDDYRFLSRLENRLRIESDQAAWALPTSYEQLTPIAKRMGYGGVNAAAELLYEVEQRRSRVRAVFDACFGREQAVSSSGTGSALD